MSSAEFRTTIKDLEIGGRRGIVKIILAGLGALTLTPRVFICTITFHELIRY